MKPSKRQSTLSILFLAVLRAGVPAEGKWHVYKNCRLAAGKYGDGDSFHVKTRRRIYLFRLYFVDTPELDDSIPNRLQEQADYWGIRKEKALQLAGKAEQFTKEFLSNSFTVYTKKEDARGRGYTKRYFAMIKVGDQYLSEALVQAGLARVYGKGTDLPDGLPERKHWANLRVAEREAKRMRKGGWQRPTLTEMLGRESAKTPNREEEPLDSQER